MEARIGIAPMNVPFAEECLSFSTNALLNGGPYGTRIR